MSGGAPRTTRVPSTQAEPAPDPEPADAPTPADAPVLPADGRGDPVRDLLEDAIGAYAHVPEAVIRLRSLRERLDGPLRVAIVGRVKAGKSTLLNALVGQRLAPTDAGECTRVVTEYRDAMTPRVVRHDDDGALVDLPVRRVDGALRLDLGGAPAERVARLVVDWPTSALAEMTLVDTPGLESLTVATSSRTRSYVADEGPGRGAGPDALIYLTRQVQPDDLAALGAFQAATGGGLHTTTLMVLSRADEAGSGGVGALAAAADLARRTAAEPAVRALGQAVVPVSGLLGLAGRTLRHRDFVAVRTLGQADRDTVDGLLLSADRFVRAEAPLALAASARAELLERLGLVGVRLAVTLVRGGLGSSDALAAELVRRSGLTRLQRLVAVRFAARGATVRAGTALRGVEALLRAHPVPGDRRLWAGLERARLASHELAELDLLARLRAADGPLPHFRDEAERLLGADGPGPAERLGLPEARDAAELRAAAEDALATWRARAADPVADRVSVDACRLLARTVESVLADLADAR